MKVTIENAEHYTWQNCDAWHLLRSEGLSVIRENMPSRASEVLHAHNRCQQVFYVLSGSATFEVNGREETVNANESIHIAPKELHRVYNKDSRDLNMLVISQPPSHADRIDIVEYSEDQKEAIRTLNYEWIQKYHTLEEGDKVSLADPKKYILDPGGMIWYARLRGQIVGTVSLMKINETDYELAKMAVTATAQGFGIGNMLIQLCINVAEQKKIKKLILYSNTVLQPAIHLYRKFGFREAPLDPGHYERANIKMERMI
jgi:mannose-6-phosphate isomerase-like protein (cupin superfamily)